MPTQHKALQSHADFYSKTMANSFAYLVLFSWPVVVFILFRLLPRAQALAWSIIGGYLALPFGIGINPPILPTFDKTLIPALSAAVMCFVRTGAEPRDVPRRALGDSTSNPVLARALPAFTRQRIRRPARMPAEMAPKKMVQLRFPLVLWLLLALLFITQILTYLTNTTPYQVGPRVLQGLGLYDAASMMQNTLVMVLPFLLAQRYLALPEYQVTVLHVLCVAGLIYSLLALFEIRMSPQLARWAYGFLAQSFGQAMRDGGFRPVVFLQHGLWLAIFLAMSAMSAFALWRHARAAGRQSFGLLAGLWLCMVLFFSHSLGAFTILVLLVPMVVLLSVRRQLLLAALIAAIMLTYPMLRGTNLVPVDSVYGLSASVSPDRAASLKFRLDNEDRLLNHANQKSLSGWGGYLRSRVFDPETGADISTTDGMWIIVMGVSGWLGYLATYGLLVIPIVLLFLRQKRLGITLATAGLCLILAANMVDMIANGTMTPVTWLIAGTLAGRSRYVAANPDASAAPAFRRRPSAA